MNINKVIAEEINVKVSQVDAAVKLLDEGSTVPFISRYRKEVTGSLNDEELRTIDERLKYLRELEERKETVLKSIDEQGALTKDLKKKIDECLTMVALEDLYRPYKPKKKTRATEAKAKGLEPLAKIIYKQEAKQSIETTAKKYIDKKKGVNNIEEAIQGALDIIAEMISDVADYRTYIRDYTLNFGTITSTTKDKELKSNYELYYEFSELINKIPTHRILAINRGEAEKVLKVSIVIDNNYIFDYLNAQIKKDNKYTDEYIKRAIEDSFTRLIWPSIENEVRNILTEKAEDKSMEVFSQNLTQILMQAPLEGKTVLGWDPAFRTGCKLSVVDNTGKVLATDVIYPTEPTTEEKMESARKTLVNLIDKYNIDVISVGNGTASRESESFIVDFFKKYKIKNVSYVIVNEAGASVYSASKLATEEFPKLNVGERSATSIARRLQDPLAELVKIEPKSIGVGQYQHDMNKKKLETTLGGVVETCVNKVGVDLNTASVSLLTYVSGLNSNIAKSIVDYREKNGRFDNREELLNVSKLGPKVYEQCAGFLRITNGSEPLDRTGVHPESYNATNKLLKELKFTKKDLESYNFSNIKTMISDYDEMAHTLKIGVETLKDIVNELEKPGRDPREDSMKPILRKDVLSIDDLVEGMVLKGTVRNAVDFGVFVDIGVHQDGLVHISEISDKYIKHPLEVVKVGDIVDVKVISIDKEKNRIGLTMKNVNANDVNKPIKKPIENIEKPTKTNNTEKTDNNQIDISKMNLKVNVGVSSRVRKKIEESVGVQNHPANGSERARKKAEESVGVSLRARKKTATKKATTKKDASTKKTATKKVSAKKTTIKKSTTKKPATKKTTTKKATKTSKK